MLHIDTPGVLSRDHQIWYYLVDQKTNQLVKRVAMTVSEAVQRNKILKGSGLYWLDKKP